MPLYLLAYQIGRLTIGESNGFLAPPGFDPANFIGWTEGMQQWMLAVAKPLGIGLLLLASGLAVAGYFATRAAWRAWLIAAWRRRKTVSMSCRAAPVAEVTSPTARGSREIGRAHV